MKKVRLGIVGLGYWGPNLLRNFVQIPSAEVFMVVDKDESRLKRMKVLYPFLQTSKSFADLLKSEVEAIVVSTPLHTHYQLVQQALLAGKHVLVEKPFVPTVGEGEDLVHLAVEKKLVLMVDHTFEYTAAVQQIREQISANVLGDIFTIDMVRVNLGLFQQDHNVIWDLAYHDISILLYVLQMMPEKVFAVGQDFVQKGIEDSAYVLLQFPHKILASIRLSWLDPNKIRRVTFVGSKKMLVYDDVALTEKIKVFDKGVSVQNNIIPEMKHFESFTEFTYLYRSGDIFIPHLDQTEPLKRMADHFVDSIRHAKKPISGGAEGLKIIKILESITVSLKSAQWEVVYD